MLLVNHKSGIKLQCPRVPLDKLKIAFLNFLFVVIFHQACLHILLKHNAMYFSSILRMLSVKLLATQSPKSNTDFKELVTNAEIKDIYFNWPKKSKKSLYHHYSRLLKKKANLEH